jgi:DNA-binding NarL/FixJ family response regulator
LSKGANAYVLKESSAGDLVRAIREAIAGRRWLSPPLSESSLRAYTEKTKSGALDPYDTLTERERQVLHMAAEGLSSKEIAASLFISPRTVEIHRARVMHKLGLSSQTELVRFAIGHGIISVEHTRN